jgi:hypothetical protein
LFVFSPLHVKTHYYWGYLPIHKGKKRDVEEGRGKEREREREREKKKKKIYDNNWLRFIFVLLGEHFLVEIGQNFFNRCLYSLTHASVEQAKTSVTAKCRSW